MSGERMQDSVPSESPKREVDYTNGAELEKMGMRVTPTEEGFSSRTIGAPIVVGESERRVKNCIVIIGGEIFPTAEQVISAAMANGAHIIEENDGDDYYSCIKFPGMKPKLTDDFSINLSLESEKSRLAR